MGISPLHPRVDDNEENKDQFVPADGQRFLSNDEIDKLIERHDEDTDEIIEGADEEAEEYDRALASEDERDFDAPHSLGMVPPPFKES